jgi:hypothetical protein
MVFDTHTRSFTALGDIPRSGIATTRLTISGVQTSSHFPPMTLHPLHHIEQIFSEDLQGCEKKPE